jgi:hypothetical protein
MASVTARITWTLAGLRRIWRELDHAQRRVLEIMTGLD